MAEETKSVRLNKAAKEFNVGIANLVDFLAKKGHNVDLNPNTRLSPEQYELLSKAFQSEREVKEQADKIELTPNNSSVTIEATGTNDKAEESHEEVIIKNIFVHPAEAETHPMEESPAPAEKAPEETTTAVPVQEETTEEPSNLSEAEPKVEPNDEPEVEPTVEEPVQQINDEPAEESAAKEPVMVGDLRIIDKIDLSAINTKLRPDKKAKNKKNIGKINICRINLIDRQDHFCNFIDIFIIQC